VTHPVRCHRGRHGNRAGQLGSEDGACSGLAVVALADGGAADRVGPTASANQFPIKVRLGFSHAFSSHLIKAKLQRLCCEFSKM